MLVLAVVSLGAAGASIESDGSGGGDTGLGEGSGSGLGEGQSGFVSPRDLPAFFDGGILATIIGVIAIAGLLVGIVGLVLGLIYWDLEEVRAFAKKILGQLAVLVGLVGVMYIIVQGYLSLPRGGGSTGALGESAAEGAGSVSSSTGFDLPLVFGALALVVVLAVLALYLGQADDGDAESGRAAAPPDEDGYDGGGNPGGASARSSPIGSVPADNDVYRSWIALADAAGANVHRDSPEQVAERAVSTGVNEEPVREITSLFEAVRYGDRGATESMERRARSARERVAAER